MATTANVDDILVAYDPGFVGLHDQAGMLEVHSSGPFSEMTGGADTYYEDFTTGLRETLSARRASGAAGGASTWFGSGAGEGLVIGIDWMAEEGADGADDGADDDEEGSADGADTDEGSADGEGGANVFDLVYDASGDGAEDGEGDGAEDGEDDGAEDGSADGAEDDGADASAEDGEEDDGTTVADLVVGSAGAVEGGATVADLVVGSAEDGAKPTEREARGPTDVASLIVPVAEGGWVMA